MSSNMKWKDKFNKIDELIDIVYKKYYKLKEENNELKKKPSILEEENFHLKDRIEQLTEENISLRTQIKILEEENKVIKNDFNLLKEKTLELIDKLEKFDEIVKEESEFETFENDHQKIPESENINEYNNISNDNQISNSKNEKELSNGNNSIINEDLKISKKDIKLEIDMDDSAL
ncbi:MAG: hypothetical protein N3A58_01620 [Spirochaetes bacterium]|nr:hypothetical protein [Spirochaetota bacterium]